MTVPLCIAYSRTVGELLVDAENLLDEGRFILAAMSARVALDSYLRQLHVAHNLPKPKRDKIGEFADSLRKAGLITPELRRTITRYAKIGGRAVHNVPVSADEVFELVSGVSAIVAGGVA